VRNLQLTFFQRKNLHRVFGLIASNVKDEIKRASFSVFEPLPDNFFSLQMSSEKYQDEGRLVKKWRWAILPRIKYLEDVFPFNALCSITCTSSDTYEKQGD
jgi:hypothetical protein